MCGGKIGDILKMFDFSEPPEEQADDDIEELFNRGLR